MSGTSLAHIAPLITTLGACLLLLGCFLVVLGIVKPKKRAIAMQDPSSELEETENRINRFGRIFKIGGIVLALLGAAFTSYYFFIARPVHQDTIAIRRIVPNQDDIEWLSWLGKRYVRVKNSEERIPGLNIRFKDPEKPGKDIAYDESADGITYVKVDDISKEKLYLISRAKRTDYADGSVEATAPSTAHMHYSEYETVAYVTEDTLLRAGIPTDSMVDSYDMPETSVFIDEVNHESDVYVVPEKIKIPDTEG